MAGTRAFFHPELAYNSEPERIDLLYRSQTTVITLNFQFIIKGEIKMSENKIPYKIYLSEEDIPKKWYNLRADMKNKPVPLLNPGTGQPLTAEEMSGIFCEELVK